MFPKRDIHPTNEGLMPCKKQVLHYAYLSAQSIRFPTTTAVAAGHVSRDGCRDRRWQVRCCLSSDFTALALRRVGRYEDGSLRLMDQATAGVLRNSRARTK
jgi:hypothetical protein